MGFGNKSRRGGFEALPGIGLVFVLFAGFERQRLAKLNCDTANKAIYVIDAADVGRAGEVGHVKRLLLAVPGDAKAGGYLLAQIGTGVVKTAGERSASAGNVDHLALGQLSVKILCKPDGPMITQSLLCSSVTVVHFF